jgi:large subunit ribosomal protein L21e
MPSSNGPKNGSRQKLSNDPRDRGSSPPQPQIRDYEEGQSVHLALDPSVQGGFHPRFNGLTGTIAGTQGSAYRVEIDDGGKTKTVVTSPAHLRAQE